MTDLATTLPAPTSPRHRPRRPRHDTARADLGEAKPIAAPSAPPAMPAWPIFTCVSCDDVYPATSFRKNADGAPTPQLKGHFVLPSRPGSCVCNSCIRAHYKMLSNGDLGFER